MRLLTGMILSLLVVGCQASAPSRREAAAEQLEPEILDLTVSVTNKFCEVHHLPLRPEILPMVYGMPATDPGFDDAKKRLFPHWWETFNGGCVGGPKYGKVLTCYQCRSAYYLWKRAKELNQQ